MSKVLAYIFITCFQPLHFNHILDTTYLIHDFISGTQKIYVKTWGCSHNNSDSEYMAGQLASYGYKITGISSP